MKIVYDTILYKFLTARVLNTFIFGIQETVFGLYLFELIKVENKSQTNKITDSQLCVCYSVFIRKFYSFRSSTLRTTHHKYIVYLYTDAYTQNESFNS